MSYGALPFSWFLCFSGIARGSSLLHLSSPQVSPLTESPPQTSSLQPWKNDASGSPAQPLTALIYGRPSRLGVPSLSHVTVSGLRYVREATSLPTSGTEASLTFLHNKTGLREEDAGALSRHTLRGTPSEARPPGSRTAGR